MLSGGGREWSPFAQAWCALRHAGPGGSEVPASATGTKASQTSRYVYPVKFLAPAFLPPSHLLAVLTTFYILSRCVDLFG